MKVDSGCFGVLKEAVATIVHLHLSPSPHLTALAVELDRALAGEPKLAFRRLTVREAYREFADWYPWTDWNQNRFDFDMATKVEPALKALGGGVFRPWTKVP